MFDVQRDQGFAMNPKLMLYQINGRSQMSGTVLSLALNILVVCATSSTLVVFTNSFPLNLSGGLLKVHEERTYVGFCL